VSDYQDIYPEYGTIADVEELIKELHDRGMKLLLDLVVNHTSDEHKWFVDSKSSKASAKRDWYIWRAPKIDAQGNRDVPNNWKASLGGGSVWEWDEATEEYYLHLYDVKMPGRCYFSRCD
jgi:oligo-1,6-glucosidase